MKCKDCPMFVKLGNTDECGLGVCTFSPYWSMVSSDDKCTCKKPKKKIKDPSYKIGDVVRFDSDVAETGVVAIVDRYGTFEQNEEPSYDIYNKEKNILYKHCRESWVKEKIGEVPEEEVWGNLIKHD